jgi:hypothetical protein
MSEHNTSELLTPVQVENIVETLTLIADKYSRVDCACIDGLFLVVGRYGKGSIDVYTNKAVPEYTPANLRVLYNAGWSQRQLGYIYGKAQGRIANLIKQRD